MCPSSWLAIPLAASSILGAQGLSKAEIREATKVAEAVLDDWHLAAAQADEARYFGRMAPEAVFVGIDPEERWTKEAFQQWVHPGFEARQVWTFKSIQRNTTLSPAGDVAWFDETLDAAGLGKARGSGVLRKEGQTWLVAQYVLSLPIPRVAFREVQQMIALLNVPAKKGAGSGH